MSPERQRPVLGEKLAPKEKRRRPERGWWSFIIDSLETVDRLINVRRQHEAKGLRPPPWVWSWTPRAEKGMTYRNLTDVIGKSYKSEWTPLRQEKMEEGQESEYVLHRQFAPLSIAANVHLVDEETKTLAIVDEVIRVWTGKETFEPAVVDYKSISHGRFLELTRKQAEFPNLPYPELAGSYVHPFPQDSDQVQGEIYILKKSLGIKAPVGIVIYRDRDTMEKLYGLVPFVENKARTILSLPPNPEAFDLSLSAQLIQGLKALPDLVVRIQEGKHEAREKNISDPHWSQFYTLLGEEEGIVYPRASEVSKCILMATFSTFPRSYRRLPRDEVSERILGAGSSADYRLKREFNPLGGMSEMNFFSSGFRATGHLDKLIRAYKTETDFEWVDLSFKEIGSGQFVGLARKGMPERHRNLPDLDTWHPFIAPREEDFIQEQLYMAFLNEMGVEVRFAVIIYENRDRPDERKYGLVEYDLGVAQRIFNIQNKLIALAREKGIQELYDKEEILLNHKVAVSQTIYEDFSEENKMLIVPIPGQAGQGRYVHAICDYCVECPHPEGWKAARNRRLKDKTIRLRARFYQRLEKALAAAAKGRTERKRRPGVLSRAGIRKSYQDISDLVPTPSPTVARKLRPEDFQLPFPAGEETEQEE